MRKAILPIVAALVAVSAPLHAARLAVTPIVHPPMWLYEAYRGSSNLTARAAQGHRGSGEELVTAVPGVLRINPGPNWANFVGAAQQSPPIPYAIKNVVLQKELPTTAQCADVFTSSPVRQQGTQNIRLWWPLMYEVAGTKWTLTILYGTTQPFDSDGPLGPNPAGYTHTEVWQWQVEVTLDSMKNLLTLFHELPFGKSQTPLISDEVLYARLQSLLAEITVITIIGDSVDAGFALGEFEMMLMDSCLSTMPAKPIPTGPGTGIAQTAENPACCKLLTDAEYLGFRLGIYQPTR